MASADATPQQLERLEGCAERVAEALGAKVHQLGGQYNRIDRVLEWPEITKHAWLVIKGRNCKHNSYPTLMLSVAKWCAGVETARATGGKFVVVAAYSDCDRIYVYDPAHVEQGQVWMEFGGRTTKTRQDRAYAGGDIEPVMHIPATLFDFLPTP